MKNIRNKRLGFTAIILLVTILLSNLLFEKRTFSLEELSSILAVCGNFIQAGFASEIPDRWDYFIVLLAGIVVIATLYFSIKYLLHPEKDRNHIKYQIIENEKKC